MNDEREQQWVSRHFQMIDLICWCSFARHDPSTDHVNTGRQQPPLDCAKLLLSVSGNTSNILSMRLSARLCDRIPFHATTQ